MNVKQIICAIVFLAGFTSCAVDYELSDSFINEPDYIVINSLLTPAKPFRIDFYKTSKAGNGYTIAPLTGVHVLLKENNQVLYDAVCEESVLEIPYYPKTGQNYSLVASVNGKETITANTRIPAPATCNTYLHDGDWEERYFHFSSFQIDTKEQSSLWITAYDVFDTGDTGQCDEIWTNHPLIDKFNREDGGMGVRNPQVGSHFHDVFLRIKNTNFRIQCRCYTDGRYL